MPSDAIGSSTRSQPPGDEPATEPQRAPFLPGDTLIECAAVARAIEDEISWLAEVDTIAHLDEHSPRPPLFSLLALINTFDGAIRIRRARPRELGPEHTLIMEGRHGWKGLPREATDVVIRPAVAEGFLDFDAAGVLHVTDQGRALIGRKGGA